MASNLKNLSDFSHTEIPTGDGLKIGIVVADFNNQITDALTEGAYNTLKKHQVKEDDIIIKRVPGSIELTLGAQLLQEHLELDAIICLGCVIQGETRHFDYVCDSVTQGITSLNIKYQKPFIFGVLTTNNLQQALDRAGGKHGNKGDEAATAAIRMASLKKELKK
ncbi:MAG: 6,7-dimethyl-8-ribityllumazine synthase [Bacteroidota bacterium]